MRQSRQVTVDLPNMKPSVCLPKSWATALPMIIKAGPEGANTLHLQEDGVINPKNAIAHLRRLGADIRTRRGCVMDYKGAIHENVGHYVYMGWKALEVANEISKR